MNHSKNVNIMYRLLAIFAMLLPCLLIVKKDMQNDTWFLLNSGRYVLEHGLPTIEPFTIHQNLEFVMQQWLSASIFWVAYSESGYLGLKLLVLVTYLVIVFCIYRLCMVASRGNFFVAVSLTLAVSAMINLWITDRPTIFSTLILVVELLLLESYRFTENRKYLLFLPFLSVGLINLHAAIWPMLFVLLIPYIIESLHLKIASLENHGYEKGPILIVTIVMISAGFINPYGIDAMVYLFKSYGSPEIVKTVGEMNPPDINTYFGIMTYCCIFLVLSTYMLYVKGDTKLRYILLTIGTTYMALSVMRNFMYFAICGIFPLAYYLRHTKFPTRQPSEGIPNGRRLRIALIASIAAVVFCIVIIVVSGDIGQTKDVAKSNDQLLKESIEFIQQENQNAEIVLYTGYNDGGMAEFMGIPAYIDPRAEVFLKKNNQKEDILKEYADLQSGTIYYKDFLDKYKFTHLILTKYDILYTYLADDEAYRTTFSNEAYILYEKVTE